MSNSRAESLVKNTLILTIGKISTQAISFFLLPLYTAYLTKQDYGVVDIVATIVTLLVPILNMQLEQGIFRFMVTSRENQKWLKQIVSTSFTFIIVQILLLTLIFIAINLSWYSEYGWFLYANLIVNMLTFLLMQTMRGLGDNVGYALAAVISSVANIGVNLLLILVFNLGAKAMLTASVMGGVAVVIFALFRVKFWQYFDVRLFDKYVLKDLLSYSVPLIPNELSWWAIRASDRFVISAFLGFAANGIVAVANKIPSVFVMFYNVFGIAWTESVVLHLKEPGGEEFFSNMTNRSFRLFSCGALIIIAVMPYIFGLLINEQFAEAYYLIPIYIIGCLFNVVIGLVSTVYIVHKRTKIIAKTSILAAVICISMSLLLVKYIGIYASPIANIVGFGVMMVYRCIDLKKYAKLKWNVGYILGLSFFAALLITTYYLKNRMLSLAALLATLLFTLVVNKSDIQLGIRYIKSRFTSK